MQIKRELQLFKIFLQLHCWVQGDKHKGRKPLIKSRFVQHMWLKHQRCLYSALAQFYPCPWGRACAWMFHTSVLFESNRMQNPSDVNVLRLVFILLNVRLCLLGNTTWCHRLKKVQMSERYSLGLRTNWVNLWLPSSVFALCHVEQRIRMGKKIFFFSEHRSC